MIGPSLGLAVRAPRPALPVRGDPWLWLAVTALGALGLVMAYSASLEEAPHPAVTPAALRHAALGGLGVAAMLVAARIDYRLLQRASAPAYLAAGALLLAVVAAGESEYGARRWLPVGGATIQPAEAAKLALVLALASYAALRPPRAAALVVTAALLLLLAGPVLLQPDTGTAVVLAGIWAGVVVAWGAPWRALGMLVGVLLAAGPLAFALAVPDYQRERLAVFLDPGRDRSGAGSACARSRRRWGRAG